MFWLLLAWKSTYLYNMIHYWLPSLSCTLAFYRFILSLHYSTFFSFPFLFFFMMVILDCLLPLFLLDTICWFEPTAIPVENLSKDSWLKTSFSFLWQTFKLSASHRDNNHNPIFVYFYLLYFLWLSHIFWSNNIACD